MPTENPFGKFLVIMLWSLVMGSCRSSGNWARYCATVVAFDCMDSFLGIHVVAEVNNTYNHKETPCSCVFTLVRSWSAPGGVRHLPVRQASCQRPTRSIPSAWRDGVPNDNCTSQRIPSLR